MGIGGQEVEGLIDGKYFLCEFVEIEGRVLFPDYLSIKWEDSRV
jgi:hypothetical protein